VIGSNFTPIFFCYSYLLEIFTFELSKISGVSSKIISSKSKNNQQGRLILMQNFSCPVD
jgi:hypothetical protein